MEVSQNRGTPNHPNFKGIFPEIDQPFRGTAIAMETAGHQALRPERKSRVQAKEGIWNSKKNNKPTYVYIYIYIDIDLDVDIDVDVDLDIDVDIGIEIEIDIDVDIDI